MTSSLQDMFDALRRGVTVLTGHKRLAGDLRQSFEFAEAGKGLEVWPTPQVMPWTDWLQGIWEEILVSGGISTHEHLLAPVQERHLWQDIIVDSMPEQPLQQVPGTVELVQEAWQLIHSWHLPLTRQRFRYNSDSEAFLNWAMKFNARCEREHWLPSDLLAARLLRENRALTRVVPDELILFGFEVLTPQEESLIQALAESGCRVSWTKPAGRQGTACMTACADERQEAECMARWVRARLEEKAAAQVGIVVPDFAENRQLVINALDRILVPHAVQPGFHSDSRPYNLSLGLPLSNFPVVGTALRLLRLLDRVIALDELSRLLRSPFISGWKEEAGSRAMLDSRLRETGAPGVELKTLRYHASRPGKPYSCPLLTENLDVWDRAAWDCPRTDTPGGWSESFTGLLEAVGWPKGRPLSSEEYQAVEAWRELLSAFASLDPITGSMNASTALGRLTRMARERIFQPQSGFAPVQVLGVIQSSWLQFDHLWVMGMHDGVWPRPARPNPFIPLPVQRDAGLPRSSEALALQAAQSLSDRMLESAGEIVMSYPERSGDEELRPSPLFAHLPPADSLSLHLSPSALWRDTVHASARLNSFEESHVAVADAGRVKGGSAVFKLQAACPFRAFAELRLGARDVRQSNIGLDSMARGLLVHRILEKIWGNLGTSRKLAAMKSAPLADFIRATVNEVMDETAGKYPQNFMTRFREIEAERLCRQVHEWLEQEKVRGPFRVVEREVECEATAGGIRVQLKIDRVDELEDGRRVVIDYKTGDVRASQWFGERPDEPQLPLYSMVFQEDVAGVLIAQVKAGAMGFRGVAEEEALVAGVKHWQKMPGASEFNSWPELLKRWRTTMERLGADFRAGNARVDPKHPTATCAYCALGSLCRIHELKARENAPDDQEIFNG